MIRNRKLCDKILSTQQAACTQHLTGVRKRECLKSSESFAESVTHQHKACRGHQSCLMNVRQLMEAAARHLGILKKN